MQHTLKALIFDVDGTLADTERDGHRVAFNKAFNDAGLTWDWDESLYGKLLAVTGGKERIKFYISDFLSNFTPPSDIDGWVKELHASKTQHYLKMLSDGEIPLRPGVEDLINEARSAGLTLAISTTTTPENVTYLLNATLGKESLNWFKVIAAGDIVPAKKPAPDIYQWCLDQLELKAEECIAFEDSYNGLISACDAGLKTIVTSNVYTKDDDFSRAHIVCNQMACKKEGFNVISSSVDSWKNANCFDLDLIKKVHRV